MVFTDPSVYKGEGAAAEDLVIGIFRKKVADLPVELEPGTPILFRRVKVSTSDLSPSFTANCKGNGI